MDPRVLGGVFLGWSLGANDAANVFGTAVSSSMVRYRTAVILTAIFVVIGALIEGMPGIRTLGSITPQSINTAFFVSLSAALTVTLMTVAEFPVSTSQAVVGGILGISLLRREIEWRSVFKVVMCWVGTPTGAALISFILYFLFSRLLINFHLHFLTYDRIVRRLLLLAGIYCAYALGANNVANVTGVFYRAGMMDASTALLVGGLSIALGALTYSKKVMYTVGLRIIPLDAFSALIAVLAEAITVHVYAIVGVPVSTSQAIVGAVVGIGFYKGVKTISINTVKRIFLAWFLTPVVGAVFSLILGLIAKLRF